MENAIDDTGAEDLTRKWQIDSLFLLLHQCLANLFLLLRIPKTFVIDA